MGRSFRSSLWLILALGAVVAGVTAALTKGDPYDMESFRLVRDALNHGPLDVYTYFAHRSIIRWPYAPAFFPWIWASGAVASAGGPGFAFMIRVPTILADGAIAWIVQDWLGRVGRSPGERLLAAGLVSLGPSFVVIAGYHGQFDAVAILPGVLAVSLWPRMQSPRRAIVVGLLIGLGAALKTVPLLLLLAVLPTARSRRELITLLLAAAAPILVAFAPFAFAGTLPALHALSYRGLPGAGDLSLAVQPSLAQLTLGIANPGASGLTEFLIRHGTLVIAAGLLVVAAVGARSRAGAPQMASLVWLGIYAFGVNFFFQYLVWGLPFFLMAGYLRSVLVAQLVLIGPTVLFYLRPWHEPSLAVVYDIVMIGMWAIAVCAFFALSWQRVRHPEALVYRRVPRHAGDVIRTTQGPLHREGLPAVAQSELTRDAGGWEDRF
jgi:hypothetical protein